MTKYSIWS